MKAVITIDMPDMCSNCPLADSGTSPSDDWNCTVTWTPRNGYMCRKKIKLEDIDSIQSWCPLRPLPQKNKGCLNYADGWNDCLKEILGEEDGNN